MNKISNMAANRSVGFITRIRLSPKDVMACLDCVSAADADVPGMSLSAAVKRGIVVAMETLRQNKVIPTRDGFEYLDMIAPYQAISPVMKVKVGHQLVVAAQQAEQYDTPHPTIPTRVEPTAADIAKGRARERILRKYQELSFRKENGGKGNWTAAEQQSLDALAQQLIE